MTSSGDSPNPSSSLPEGLGTLEEQQSFKNRLRRLDEKIMKVGAAAQHNDELLVDAVRNLELRVNMVMAVLRDLANGNVKFVGNEAPVFVGHKEIDLEWYYEQVMKGQEEQEAITENVTTPEKEYPEDAVIFGDDT